MSARLDRNSGLLYDHGMPLRKMAMDRAPPPAPELPMLSLVGAVLRQSPHHHAEVRKMERGFDALPVAQQPEYLHQCRARLNEILAGAVTPAPPPSDVTVDTDEALRDLRERNELRRLIPHLDRLSNR